MARQPPRPAPAAAAEPLCTAVRPARPCGLCASCGLYIELTDSQCCGRGEGALVRDCEGSPDLYRPNLRRDRGQECTLLPRHTGPELLLLWGYYPALLCGGSPHLVCG
eukprot:COSAG01_NODE_10055_length_2261_cov_1.230342_2_plen_108_part_00